jgi:hypothetical protein
MRGLGVVALCSLIACGEPTPASDGESSTGETSGSGSTDPSTSTTSAPTTSASTTSTSTGEPTTDADSSTSASTDDTSGFELDCHTELDAGTIAFRCNLPRLVDECTAIADAPCDDVDGDALTDAWEDLALDRLRPLRRFDEGESLIDDADAVMGDVGRVFAVDDRIRIFVMLGYHYDYGSCGFTSHNGDSERVALDLEIWPDGGAGGVRIAQAYTAAHENTATDHSRVYPTADLGLLVYDVVAEPRWVVYPSRDKHGTYGNIDICETVSMVPCLDEDCAPDDVDDPAAFDRLPDFVNAGEPDAPRVTALDVLGFPGDDAWLDQDFCGGLERNGCSAPVVEKLTVDPF